MTCAGNSSRQTQRNYWHNMRYVRLMQLIWFALLCFQIHYNTIILCDLGRIPFSTSREIFDRKFCIRRKSTRGGTIFQRKRIFGHRTHGVTIGRNDSFECCVVETWFTKHHRILKSQWKLRENQRAASRRIIFCCYPNSRHDELR